MKAIIIAAGLGSRMGTMTNDKPKCMLEFDGKPLLQIQLETLRAAGIHDISVITGYKREKICFPDITYFVNDNFENNNILASLFYAQEALTGDVLVSYCDILYTKDVVDRLIKVKDDICVVVDTDWKKAYEGRENHPLSEAENVIFDGALNVQKIGKIIEGRKEDMPGEFIGMFKLSDQGCETFKQCYAQSRSRYLGKPFQKAATFEKAYITDMMQELVDQNIQVSCCTIKGGWREIDTIEDFNKAQTILKEVSYA